MKKLILYILLLTATIQAQTVEEAKKLYKEQKYKEAIEIFEKYPNDGEALFYLSKVYIDHVDKNITKAIDLLNKATKLDNPAAYNLLGALYQYGEGVDKDGLMAIMHYKKAIELGDTIAYLNIGKMYEQGEIVQKNYTEAEKYYLESTKKGNNQGFLALGQMYLFEIKEYKKAEEYFLKAERNGLELGYFNLGFIYHYHLKDYKKAEKYYKKDIEFFPKKDRSFTQLGFLYFTELKINNKAEEYFLKAVEYGNKNIYSTLGDLYSLQNEIKKAEECYKKAIELNAKNVNKCELVELYRKIDPIKAYDIAMQEIKNHHENEKLKECYSYLGALFSNIDGSIESIFPLNYKKSIEYFKLAEKYNTFGSSDFFSSQIGDLYSEIGDKKEAKKWYEKAYEIAKDKQYLNKINKLELSKKTDSKTDIFPILNNIKFIDFRESSKYCVFSTTIKYIQVIDKENQLLINELRGDIGRGLIGYILDIAIDEKNNIIYSTTNHNLNQINIFDINTSKLIDYIKLDDHIDTYSIQRLLLSEDGRVLIAYDDYKINIIDTFNKEQQCYKLKKYNNKTFLKEIQIDKKNNDYLINILTFDNFLHTFSFDQKRKVSKILFQDQIKFVNSKSSQCKSIYENNNLKKDILDILFKQNKLYVLAEQNKNYIFNFDDFKLTMQSNELLNPDIRKSKINLKVTNNNSMLEIYDDKKLLSEIPLLYFGHTFSKTLDNDYVVVFTEKLAQQLIFSKNGQLLAKLEGNNILQTNAYLNNGYLYTYGKDNIIHIFDLTNLQNSQNKPVEYVSDEIKQIINNINENFVFESFDKSSNNYLGFLPTIEQVRKFVMIEDGQKVEVKSPIVSLYVENKNDWILYTPEGLFTYGGEGYKLLKYHQNQGLYKEARIIENEKLFDKFYRPDLIKRILSGEKVDIPLDVKSVILNIKPPELQILSKKMISKKDIDITYQVCDAGNGVADPKLLINGQAINPTSRRGFSEVKIQTKDDKCKVYQSSHTLSPGENTISLKAYDKDKIISSQSDTIKVVADYKVEEKANLYFLSIAVSDYMDDSFDLKYPVSDATKVKEMIKQKSNYVYENIYTYALHDKDVNLENINKAFDEIKDKIKINDAFVLYIAGHGVSLESIYNFIPYDQTEKISIYEIKTNLSKLENDKSLLLLDTCQSGAAIDGMVDETTTINRLSHDDKRNYIVASSKNQIALEGYKDHGVFTYSVLDAFINNNKLKVWGLAEHISEVVPKITQEKFHFSQTPQAKLNQNFILVGGKD